jgi:hypothetical protein
MNARTNLVLAGLLLAAVSLVPSTATANVLVDPEFNGVPPLSTLAPVFGPPFILGQWGAENGAIVSATGVAPLTASTMLAEYPTGGTYTQTMQATDVSAYPVGTIFNLSAYFNVDQNLAAAQAFVNLSFYDATYTSLGLGSSAGLTLDNNPATWEPISLSFASPLGTQYAVAQVMYLESTLFDSTGTVAGTGYVDSASLRAVPEPATMVLFGMTAVGLTGLAWRRQRTRRSLGA